MFKHVKYKGAWYVLGEEEYIEYMNIPRDLTNPTVDPYKFSVAMIWYTVRKMPYVTLITGYESNFEVGLKRDWIAFVEAINEGIKLFQKDIDRRAEIKEFRKRDKK